MTYAIKSFTCVSEHTFSFAYLYNLHKQQLKTIKCTVGETIYLKEYSCHQRDDRVSYVCKALEFEVQGLKNLTWKKIRIFSGHLNKSIALLAERIFPHIV